MIVLPDVLAPEKAELLIAAAKLPVEKAICQTLYSTGILPSELVGLKKNAIQRQIIRRKGEHYAIVRNRSGDERKVPFDDEALRAITDYHGSPSGSKRYLFETENGRRYRIGELLTLLNRLAQAAGLEETIGRDTLSRACELRLLNSGINLWDTETMLGRPVRLTEQAKFDYPRFVPSRYPSFHFCGPDRSRQVGYGRI